MQPFKSAMGAEHFSFDHLAVCGTLDVVIGWTRAGVHDLIFESGVWLLCHCSVAFPRKRAFVILPKLFTVV